MDLTLYWVCTCGVAATEHFNPFKCTPIDPTWIEIHNAYTTAQHKIRISHAETGCEGRITFTRPKHITNNER